MTWKDTEKNYGLNPELGGYVAWRGEKNNKKERKKENQGSISQNLNTI